MHRERRLQQGHAHDRHLRLPLIRPSGTPPREVRGEGTLRKVRPRPDLNVLLCCGCTVDIMGGRLLGGERGAAADSARVTRFPVPSPHVGH